MTAASKGMLDPQRLRSRRFLIIAAIVITPFASR